VGTFFTLKKNEGYVTSLLLKQSEEECSFVVFFEGIISIIVLVLALEAEINMMGLAQNKFICSPPE